MFEILVTEKLHFNVVFRNSTVPVPRFAVKFKRRQNVLTLACQYLDVFACQNLPILQDILLWPTQSQIRMISHIISLLV